MPTLLQVSSQIPYLAFLKLKPLRTNFFCKIFTVICFFLSGLVQISAQTVPVVRYTTDDGLVQRQVMALFEDSKGYLWIGTKGGISRFDGYQFLNLTVADGLISNSILSFVEPGDGTIWAFSKEGASVFETGNSISNRDYIGKFQFAAAAADSAGTVWMILNDGVKRILAHQSNDVFDIFPTDPALIGNLECLYFDEYSNQLLLKSANGYFRIAGMNISRITDFVEYPYLVEGSWKKPADKREFSNLLSYSSNSVFFPTGDKENLMVCNRDGSCFLRPINESSGKLFYKDTLDQTLELIKLDFYTSPMYRDSFDQLWVGTEGGLVKIPSMAIRNYFDPVHLSDVWTVLEDRSGRIWFGNYGAGLSYLDGNVVKKADPGWFSPNGSISKRGKDLIYPQGIIGFNRDLFINTSRGVLRWDGSEFRLVPGIPSDRPIYASLFDSTGGYMLFSVFDKGIYELLENGQVRQLVEKPGPAFDYIWSMVQDDYGTLWLGSSDTIAIFKDGRTMSLADAGCDFSYGAKAMACDSLGWLWVANDYGLFALSCGDEGMKFILTAMDGPVNALQILPDGRMAIGTPGGIGLVDLNAWDTEGLFLVTWINLERGFEGGACKDNGLSLDSKGRLWVACEKGAVSLQVDNIWESFNYSRIVLESVWVINDGQYWSQVLSKNQPVIIPPDPSMIRFDYSCPDLTDAGRISFRIRLLPMEEEWNDLTTDREVTYRFLGPGKYRLEIESESEKVIDSKGFDFTVLPRWYQTLGFRIGASFLSLIFIVGVTWWLTRRRQQRKQDMINREKQIEDLRLRVVTNQLSPHFTQNVLSAIGSLVLEEKPMDAYLNITKFSRMLHSLLATQERFLVPLQQELDFVTNYLDLEMLRFTGKLNYITDVDPDVAKGTLVPRMILQIPVENAIKHGLFSKPNGGTITITIRNGIHGELLLFVKDNGVGRARAMESRMESNGRGLRIIREILEYLNQLEGAANQIRIIDLTDEDQPIGTLVEIILKGAMD